MNLVGGRRRLAIRARQAWHGLLEIDNHVIGFFICLLAVYDWVAVYDGIGGMKLYFSQGVYALPSLSTLNTLFSAIYLTAATIILLSLKRPHSRYTTVLPNLTAVLAAFTVYMFAFVPSGDLLRLDPRIALALIVAGAGIIIAALVFLRQAFSVTPQARFLVRSGPYAFVRHPMYVGNILSILGLALLIDSVEAYAVFVICSVLQIGRAFYEERLLARDLAQYADYKAGVGRFFPRMPRRKTAISVICFWLLHVAGDMTAIARPIAGSGNGIAVIPVASRIDWPKRCGDWARKAQQSRLFTPAEMVQMDEADAEKLASIAACKAFFDLRTSCQEISGQWMGDELGDAAFLDKLDAAPPGCKIIVANNACDAMKKIAQSGVRLSDDRQAFFAQCVQVAIINRRFEQIRPGM